MHKTYKTVGTCSKEINFLSLLFPIQKEQSKLQLLVISKYIFLNI